MQRHCWIQRLFSIKEQLMIFDSNSFIMALYLLDFLSFTKTINTFGHRKVPRLLWESRNPCINSADKVNLGLHTWHWHPAIHLALSFYRTSCWLIDHYVWNTSLSFKTFFFISNLVLDQKKFIFTSLVCKRMYIWMIMDMVKNDEWNSEANKKSKSTTSHNSSTI